MANPQVENGYTKIANEIMDALIRQEDLSGQELRVSLFILRKTYGFNKKEDYISLSQIGKAIKASKIRCSQIVNSLQLMKILIVKENINGKTKKYMFNKDYEQWNTVNKKLNRIYFTNKTVKQNINHKRQYKRKRICDLEKSPSLSQEKNNKKPTRKETNPQVREIISYFFSTLKDMHEIKSLPVEAADAKLVKLALQKLDAKKVKDLLHWYLSKGFLKDGSPDADKYRLRLALSNFQIDEFKEKGAWLYGY